ENVIIQASNRGKAPMALAHPKKSKERKLSKLLNSTLYEVRKSNITPEVINSICWADSVRPKMPKE
ncbi:hypothetical protein HAX54_048667, partial [Datura stramonium]|nr:hypothetical protein [Datura stramonium]